MVLLTPLVSGALNNESCNYVLQLACRVTRRPRILWSVVVVVVVVVADGRPAHYGDMIKAVKAPLHESTWAVALCQDHHGSAYYQWLVYKYDLLAAGVHGRPLVSSEDLKSLASSPVRLRAGAGATGKRQCSWIGSWNLRLTVVGLTSALHAHLNPKLSPPATRPPVSSTQYEVHRVMSS